MEQAASSEGRVTFHCFVVRPGVGATAVHDAESSRCCCAVSSRGQFVGRGQALHGRRPPGRARAGERAPVSSPAIVDKARSESRPSQSAHHACRGRQHDADAPRWRHRAGRPRPARQLRRAYSCFTTAWDGSPSGSSTSPTAIRREFGITSDNPLYKPYEGSGHEVNIIGWIRWFAREM